MKITKEQLCQIIKEEIKINRKGKILTLSQNIEELTDDNIEELFDTLGVGRKTIKVGGLKLSYNTNGELSEIYRKSDGVTVKIEDDNIEFLKNGVTHRDGGLPAIIYISGHRMWYENGKLVKSDRGGRVMRPGIY